jgi:hypothetical protein
MSTESDLAVLRRRLAQLPQEAPPPSLWMSLQVEHARLYPARRAWRWPYALAAIAASALALSLVPLLRQPTILDSQLPRAADIAPGNSAESLRVHSAHLQRDPLPAATAAAVQVLDRELQRRYLDGASDAELAPLWRQREELLQRPAASAPAPQSVRI